MENYKDLILLHMVDQEVLSCSTVYNSQHNKIKLVEELDYELKLLVLFMDYRETIVLPPTYYYESELCRALIHRNFYLMERGIIKFFMNRFDYKDFVESKQHNYTSVQRVDKYYNAYYAGKNYGIDYLPISISHKQFSSGRLSFNMWDKIVMENIIKNHLDYSKFNDLFKNLEEESRKSFTWELVANLLDKRGITHKEAKIVGLRENATMAYLKSHDENGIKIITGSRFTNPLLLPFIPQNEFNIGEIQKFILRCDLHDKISSLSNKELLSLRSVLYNTLMKIKFGLTNKLEIDNLDIMNFITSFHKFQSNSNVMNSTLEKVHFGVITALPKEFAAMKKMLSNTKKISIKDDPNDYIFGTIKANERSNEIRVALVLLKKMANIQASSAATNLLRTFPTTKHVIMVGIAGGVPNPSRASDHVRLGDIVVSNESGVLQLDLIKLHDISVKLRISSMPPSSGLLGKVKLLEAERIAGHYPWEEYFSLCQDLESVNRPSEESDVLYSSEIEGKILSHPLDEYRKKRYGKPKIHYGRIGSSNILLKNSKIRDSLGRDYDVKAIEMEGSGVADGTWTHNKGFIVIRGICDYCDSHKNDTWQGYAAVVAASYCRTLIESFSVSELENEG